MSTSHLHGKLCLTLKFERVKSSKYAFSFLKNFTYIPQNFQLPFPSFSQILSLTITSLHNPPKKNRKEKELPIRAISITISDDPFHQQRWSFSLIKLNMCFLVRVCSSIFGLALMGLWWIQYKILIFNRNIDNWAKYLGSNLLLRDIQRSIRSILFGLSFKIR